MQVGAAAAVVENLHQARQPAGAHVRQHQNFSRRAGLSGILCGCSGQDAGLHRGLRQDFIHVVHDLGKALGLAVARMRQPHGEVRANARRVVAQHDDAVGQRHGFFDVVGDHKNRARGNLVPVPQFQQFAAQRFRGQHVERGERLVHEKHFRLDHQRPRKADALLHSAG